MPSLRYLPTQCVWFLSVVLLRGVALNDTASAMCYPTPRSAVDGIVTNHSADEAASDSGYRVAKVQADSVLGIRWAFISSCAHPEWPQLVLSAPGAPLTPSSGVAKRASVANSAPSIVVHPGDIVRLWKEEGLLRIDVAGVSEESGGVGKTIRVRLLPVKSESPSSPEEFFGVVRGPLNVEIQR